MTTSCVPPRHNVHIIFWTLYGSRRFVIESRPMSLNDALHLMKDFLLPIGTFFAGLFGGLSQYVQKPLTEYRETLTDISQLMLRSVHVLFDKRDRNVPASPEEKKLYDDLRLLHGRLVSSSDAIPGFARPVLRMLGLLRSRKNNDEGAKMLIGISNQVVSPYKDLSHIRVCSEKLGKALGITV
ncbi:MAG: hypothetical protein Udaeo2_26730 [Candidatus Udaeobacter sp.]|jgi:hypothetical protein|nr:MAG: hypothetical protein Udaeo2_26730 [Candidatus Udaeobacter sp.]